MILLKPGVILKDLQPQCVLAINIVHELWQSKGIRNLTITSCNDSVHMKSSLHYKGLAFDVRTKDINLLNRQEYLRGLTTELKGALQDEFDVLLENIGTKDEHIHIEYDPKPLVNKLPS